jgi:hypothetical protein
MSKIDLPGRHHLDAITSERWTASDKNRWTPQLQYARAASSESTLIGKNAPHRLVKIRGHLNIRLAVGVFKEMARSTSASQWVQHPSGVSRWRDEGDDPWTVRLGLSQPDSSIYPIYLPVF